MKVTSQSQPSACSGLKIRVHFGTSLFFLTEMDTYQEQQGLLMSGGQTSVSYYEVPGQYQGLGDPHNLDMSLNPRRNYQKI